jgi:hypothetical protein
MSNQQSWKRGAIRSFVLYTCDMAAAVTGWVYGFGLEVHNWWALIGCMVAIRWVFHVTTHAFYIREAQFRAGQAGAGGGK